MKLSENITEILAIMAAFFSFLFIFMIAFIPIPEENKDMVNILATAVVVGTITGVYGYYFGQSKKRDQPPVEPGQTVTSTQETTITEIKPTLKDLQIELEKAQISGNTPEITRIQNLINNLNL